MCRRTIGRDDFGGARLLDWPEDRCEELRDVELPDVVRPIGVPSRGCECCSDAGLGSRIGVHRSGGALIASHTDTRGSARVAA
jgi:hypothetical protein